MPEAELAGPSTLLIACLPAPTTNRHRLRHLPLPLAQLFAPFVDITVYPAPNLMATVDATGQLFSTLAFITADPANQPAWAGLSALDLSQQYYLDQVRGGGWE